MTALAAPPQPGPERRERPEAGPLATEDGVASTTDRTPLGDGELEVRVVRDPGRRRNVYEISEPPLHDAERALLPALSRALLDALDQPPPSGVEARRIDLRRRARDVIRRVDPGRDASAVERISYFLVRDLVGFGPIEAPMLDPAVEDISCTGVGRPIFVHHRTYGAIPTNVRFGSAAALDRFVRSLAQRAGRSLTASSPMVEATLPEGARLHATLGTHVTAHGSTFSIRRFRERPLTPIDLLLNGTLDAEGLALLWLGLEHGRSFLVCGGTASGKTTTLNALLALVRPGAKIVSIEDTREIHLAHENWVALSTRPGIGGALVPGGRPVGEVEMYDLLAAALRQSPQYLAVGEVRGAEAETVFHAMASGKACLATFHAEDLAAMAHRLESPPISLPRSLLASLGFVLLERVEGRGSAPIRRIAAVSEVVRLDPDTNEIVSNPARIWDPSDDTFHAPGPPLLLERLAEEGHRSVDAIGAELARRTRWLEGLARAARERPTDDPLDHEEFARALGRFYREAEGADGGLGPRS